VEATASRTIVSNKDRTMALSSNQHRQNVALEARADTLTRIRRSMKISEKGFASRP
jgi:hypothetical protein